LPTKKVGQALGRGEPEGKFMFEPKQTDKKIMLLLSGSGITPVLSIIKSVLTSEPKALLY
jgi:ring-1,2-phenylacetyl-CoA epoxidase subunit PaaE